MPIITRPVSYQDGDVALSGVLTLDDSMPEQRPGIFLIHGGSVSTITPDSKAAAMPSSATSCWRGHVRRGCRG